MSSQKNIGLNCTMQEDGNVVVCLILCISMKRYLLHEGTNISSRFKGKGKAIPLQAWAGPKGSRRLRLPDFKAVNT
jgi:hypothetical protein